MTWEIKLPVDEMFRTMNPDFYRFSSLRSSVICLEGSIGVGKSTLGKHLEAYLNSIDLKAKFFTERVDYNFLKYYIADMKKYAFPFQVRMLAGRVDVYREAQEFAQTGGISIIDRSITGDVAFAFMQYEKGFFDEKDWEIFNSILRSDAYPAPHLILYLNCAVDTCLRRIKTRGISSESNYTSEYLEGLNKSYNYSMGQVKGNIKKIDWDRDRLNQDSTLDEETCRMVCTVIRDSIYPKEN